MGPLETLIISLARRTDRWEGVLKRLTPLETSGVLKLTKMVATDGKTDQVPDDVVTRDWTTDRNARFDGRQGSRPGVRLRMTAGERGCAMSHVRAWRSVVSGSVPVLILEDDAIPKRSMQHLRRLCMRAEACDADVLYLGYIQGAPWRGTPAKQLREAHYLWTTVAYVLWPRGAQRLLDALPVDQPVDNFMGWLCASHRLRTLAAHPELIDQEGEWDQGSDVPHSDDQVLDMPLASEALT